MIQRAHSALALATIAALAACSFEWPPAPPPVSPIPAYAGPSVPKRKTAASDRNTPPPPAPPKSPSLFDRILDQRLADDPALGRYLGLHEFDGKIGDYSRAAIEARLARVEKQRAEIAAVDKAGLTADGALDRELLLRDMDLFLFRQKDLREWRRSPRFYEEIFDVSNYLERDYAPLEERAKKLVAHEHAALEQVAHIRENLVSPMSRPVLETQVKVFQGYAEYLRGEVVKQLKGIGDAAFQADFAKTNEKLAAEAEALVKQWKTVDLPKADDSHVLGEAHFRKLLLVQEGLNMPLTELKRLGEENLAQNKKDYEALAKQVTPKRTTSATVFADASRLVDASRKFLIDKKIVSIPSEDRVTPKESPPFMRWNPAFLLGPGPFETKSVAAFYYITRPDPTWPKKDQEGYLMPLGVLLSTTVHETYPGHFLQALWARKAPTRVQKTLDTYSFREGWAHYIEQMMIEEGFGADDPQNRLGQLTDALLRNCRLVVSLGLHAEKMTMAQAEKRFLDDCHQDKATAHEQAVRGTFDAGYFAYTLGKIEFLALREDAKKQLGAKFSLQRFHDALLAHGSPPVPLIRDRVLRELTEAAK